MRNFRATAYGRSAWEDDAGVIHHERWLPPSFVKTGAPVEILLEYMDWQGVDKAILVQALCYGEHDAYVSDCITRYPGRFFGCATVDVHEGETALRKLRHAVEDLGLRGLCLHPVDEIGAFWLDDPVVMRQFELASQYEIYVTVQLSSHRHAKPLTPEQQARHGMTKPILEPRPSTFRGQYDRLVRILERFPELRIAIDHLDKPMIDEDPPYPDFQKLLALARYPNVYATISALPFFSHEEYPYNDTHRLIRMACEAFGPQRLMWGSDFPVVFQRCTYEQTLNLVRTRCDFLTGEDLEWILGKTALSLLNFE